MNVKVSAQIYPSRAHFKALNKDVLVTPLKTFENLLLFQESVMHDAWQFKEAHFFRIYALPLKDGKY